MPAWADDERHDDERHFPQAATFSTLITASHNIEGLTGDNRGNLYTAALDPAGGGMCPVWRINIENPSLVVVGYIPPPSIPAPGVLSCSPLGLAFNHAGKLFVTDRNKIYSFFPDAEHPPVADLFASGVLGTHGVVFDRDGNLWTGDSTTGQGRVWKITPQGAVTEVFRVQAMSNDVTDPPHNSGFGGVGRAVVHGLVSLNTLELFSRYSIGGATQQTVASGLAFDKDGNLFVADTARGAIWKVTFDRDGNLQSKIGCDTTFPANTLCLENVFVIHPWLEGADGIALDQGGNMWVSVGERNALVGVTNSRKVVEVFRNEPDAVTRRRNLGPLEFPTSPFLSDSRFCTANSNEARRDNSPRPDGGGGKISCLDQRLSIPGMPLPVR